MTVARNIIFANHTAYSIQDTLNYVVHLRENLTEEEFPVHVYDHIIAYIMDVRYMVEIDLDEFIPDPRTGVLTLLELWLRRWGVVDTAFDYLDEEMEIGTWDETSLDDYEGEEAITVDDEDELLVGVRILATLNAQTQDLDLEELSTVSV